MGVMKFLGMGKAAGDAIATPVVAVGNVLDALFTSDEERLDKKEAFAKLAQVPHIAQTEINKLEAQHRSTFVAGWRPSIGWVCGISLACYFIPQYAIGSIVWGKLCFKLLNDVGAAELVKSGLPAYPVDAKGLLELVIALLGMGGIRMLEKMAGKAK